MDGKWNDDPTFTASYQVSSDTVTVVKPLDEDSLSDKNVDKQTHYRSGGINMNRRKEVLG